MHGHILAEAEPMGKHKKCKTKMGKIANKHHACADDKTKGESAKFSARAQKLVPDARMVLQYSNLSSRRRGCFQRNAQTSR